MNGMNNSTDDSVECPLCMEPLEVDDLNFYPCTCGYQICRFCWHRIRTDENELCPACRKAYPENPADFKPLTQEQITAFKAEKRQRDQQRKQKITENRKHLANVRVVQKNLVFVVGLPPRLADADILKKHDYFGKYGKIHKVVINPSTTYAGVQGPSASAYVTYVHNNDALRAIQNVNNITIDGRQIKTSLGTTKYCSHFMKNQQCPKGDCMYLHELGDQEASFTKEEMHQCKHQEYEKRLHDALIASAASQNPTAAPLAPMHGSTGTPSVTTEFKIQAEPVSGRVSESSAPIKISNKNNNGDNKLVNGNSSNSGSSSGSSQEAWPSLSVSPVNNKEVVNNKKGNNKDGNSSNSNKEPTTTKASKKDKKNKKQSNHNKENQKDSANPTSTTTNGSTTAPSTKSVDSKHNSINEKDVGNSGNKQQQQQQNRKRNNSSKSNISPDDEVQFIEYIEKECNGSDDSDIGNGKNTDTRSLSSSSSNNSDSTSSLSESTSGKSSPGNEFPDHTATSSTKGVCLDQAAEKKISTSESLNNVLNSSSTTTVPHPEQTSVNKPQIPNSNLIDSTTAGLSNLNLFDSNNSFLVQSFHPMLKKLEAERGQQLPDLINVNHKRSPPGIDGYQNHLNNGLNGSASSSSLNGGLGHLNGINNLNNLVNLQNQLNYNQPEDWEQVLKLAMLRNNKQMEERNNLLNMMGNGLGKSHGLLDFNTSQNFNGAMDPSALFPMQRELQLHNQQQQNGFGQNDNLLGSDLFGPNMSKFFDFHKNQQQQQQQQAQQNYMMNNGHNLMNQRDHHMGNMMDSRVNRQFLEQQQMNQLGNKFDGLPPHHMLGQQSQQKQPSRMSVFPQMTSNADDDLGFDPFVETQKGLAELIENEQTTPTSAPSSNSSSSGHSRPRMPPPGFNHIPPSSGLNGFGPRQPPHFQQQQQTSKILPFMTNQNQSNNGPNFGNNGWNLPNNFGGFGGMFHQQQQQQQQMSHQMNDPQMHLGVLGQNQNGGNQHKGFGSIPDWTSVDPAILSFRQYPSFSSQQQQQQQQIPPHLQNPVVAEKFMQHLAQQHQQQQQQQQQSVQQQNGQGFGLHGAPNQQQNPQQQSQQQQQQNQQQSSQQAQVNASVQGMLEYLQKRQLV